MNELSYSTIVINGDQDISASIKQIRQAFKDKGVSSVPTASVDKSLLEEYTMLSDLARREGFTVVVGLGEGKNLVGISPPSPRMLQHSHIIDT